MADKDHDATISSQIAVKNSPISNQQASATAIGPTPPTAELEVQERPARLSWTQRNGSSDKTEPPYETEDRSLPKYGASSTSADWLTNFRAPAAQPGKQETDQIRTTPINVPRPQSNLIGSQEWPMTDGHYERQLEHQKQPVPAQAKHDGFTLHKHQQPRLNHIESQRKQDVQPDPVIYDLAVKTSEAELEEYLNYRRPSITFSPEVILDSGDRRGLEEPLPRLTIPAKDIDKSAYKDSERYPSKPMLARVLSEANLRDYDPITGRPLLHRPSHFAQDTEFTPSTRSPFSSTFGTSALPEDKNSPLAPLPNLPPYLEPPSDQAESSTSELTVSPITEAITPPDSMDILTSPISTFPAFSLPHSLEDSSAWPIPFRRSSTARAKSYHTERKSSLRQSPRQSSRRSTAASISASPATAFLSRFAREEPAQEPDSEGQEVGEYVIGKQVGFGGFSVIKEAYTLEGGDKICRAVKIVRKHLPSTEEAENDRLQAEFDHEVQLWRCLGHRNILPLIEVYDTEFATFCFTKLNTGGTLFDKIRKNRQGLPKDLARRYTYQLASAIRYLHEDVRIVHRDIKLENCLIDMSDPDTAKDGGNVLLCDFGLAEFITFDLRRSASPDPASPAASQLSVNHRGLDLDTTSHENTDTASSSAESDALELNAISEASTTEIPIAGSLQYASPETLLSPTAALSPAIDIWSFGIVLYALLAGDLPFQHVFQPRVQMMILAGEWDAHVIERSPGAKHAQEEALELLRGCLNMKAGKRWTVGRVLRSRWLAGMQELLEEQQSGGFKL